MSAALKLEQPLVDLIDFGGRGLGDGSVLDLVCVAAGAERVVLVDQYGRVDVVARLAIVRGVDL